MQRNYPRMFSPADDQGKDGFKLENTMSSENERDASTRKGNFLSLWLRLCLRRGHFHDGNLMLELVLAPVSLVKTRL